MFLNNSHLVYERSGEFFNERKRVASQLSLEDALKQFEFFLERRI